MKKSFVNTAVSRSFRLMGRGVIGGFAIAKVGRTIGMVVGKEAQRIGGIIADGVRNTMKGNEFGKGMTAQYFAKKFYASTTSHSRTMLRRKSPKSYILKKHSLYRKARIITRIPNTVVPGRPLSPRALK